MNLIVARSLVHSPHCGVWRRVTLNSLPTTKIRCAYSWLNSRFSTDSGRLLVRTLPRNSTNTRQQWPKWRYFASGPPSPDDTDFSKLRRLEDANPERIHGIQVNPDSIGSEVLPGNLVYKFYKWTGNTRKVPLELVHGYFWMVNDLRVTKGKPTFSNKEMITEEEAQIFPMLTGLESLSRKVTDLPYLFIADKDVKCTLVNISFRDSGYKNIPSWATPFSEAFEGDQSFQSIKVSITERWSLYMLRGTLANLMRRNTPPKEHDSTLLYFGSDVDDFRDVLRMHNLMTNYVFLVDGRGRVRFAGSGEAKPEEVERVIACAKKLSSSPDRGQRTKKQRKQ